MIKHPDEKAWAEKLFAMFGRKTIRQAAKNREIHFYSNCNFKLDIL